ncbi:MAG: VWA domain-containing protein [Fusobacteriaceae bacterium]|jgi:uncharacterized protein YegL|nr:VWA domain-containing protein [Fusobacteriaceae bacterium]
MDDLAKEKKERKDIKERKDDLIVNPTPRCACILVLDVSGSMSGEPISELNKGFVNFIEEVKSDELAQYSVEIGIVTAGGGVRQELPITPVHLIEAVSTFQADGDTPLGGAVRTALHMLEGRKSEYKKKGVPYYQPWLVIISDGEPNDDWIEAANMAHEMSANRKLVVMAIGVSDANLDVLAKFSNRPAKKLAGLKFREFFIWLSASMARVSSSASTTSQVILPSTDGWDSI